MKKITFGRDAQEKLLEGIGLLSDAVGSTMGAHGQTVLYQYGDDTNGVIRSTKDGVTVAKHVQSEDPVKNAGINIVKDAARKTAATAGDGTTTSTVLAASILKQAVQRNGSQRDYIRGIEAASKRVLEYLDKTSTKVTEEKLQYVASIATNNDEELGEIISDAFKKVGEYGYVWHERNNSGIETYSKIESGAQIPSGFVDPGFINNLKTRTVDMENPYIFLSTAKIDSLRQLENPLKKAMEENRALVVIADLDPTVSSTMLMNKLKNQYKFHVISPPHHGIFQREAMEDLSALVGATLHGVHLGDGAETITSDMLGTCDFLQSDHRYTVVRIKDKVDLSERITNIENQIKKEGNPDRVKTLKRRLATLAGGVAMVYVGAPSEGELDEKIDRVDDAIHAVSASLTEGILPGGGVALRDAAEEVSIPEGNDAYTEGFSALLTAILTPYTTILSNAGLKPPTGLKKGWGVNVLTGKKVDMYKEGVIDPTLATKEALLNAVSVSKTILSTGLTINNI